MNILNTTALESNRQIKINFDGGDLSSDAGLFLIKEFVSKLGIDKLLSHSFKTNRENGTSDDAGILSNGDVTITISLEQ